MARTGLSLCSRALMNLGAAPINSFDTPGDTAKFLKEAYPAIVEEITSTYQWECMKTKKELTREAVTPPPGFLYSFVMPGDLIGAPISVSPSAQPWSASVTGYEVRGRRIVSNWSRLWIEYAVVKPEAEWPAWFAQLVVGAICSEIAFMVTDQQNVKDYWEVKTYGTPSENRVGGLMGQAMTLDAQGSGNNPGIYSDAFLEARFGAVYPGESF